MNLVGIDPGVTGALAQFQDSRLIAIADIPTFDGRVDGIELSALLQGADMVYLENTHPMPKNGSIASYKLGLNTGIIIGCVQSLAIPLTRISVHAWRSWNGLGKASKDASRGLARELYPQLADELRLAKHHNRAEAVLIGRYGVYRQLHERNADEDRGVDRHPAGGTGRADRGDRGVASTPQTRQRDDQGQGGRVVPLQPTAARR
jgi:crossover junction endodeoxyribonuclease RuvC